MSVLVKKDLHTPFSDLTLQKVFGHIEKLWFNQFVAANQSLTPLAGQNPWSNGMAAIKSLTFFSSQLAASGESLVIDVQVTRQSNNTTGSILTSTFTYDATYSAASQIVLPLNSQKAFLNPGDVVQVSYVYTAGGGPTMTSTHVQLEAFG